MKRHVILRGDSRRILRKKLKKNSVHAIVTDPPYELSFMSRSWDRQGISFDPDFWRECLRVLKPGGHLLSFGGTRTWHRIAVAIEDAGFEIRDTCMWLFVSGFPKSLNVSKAIDGAIGTQSHGFNTAGGKEKFDPQDKSFRSDYGYRYEPKSEEAAQWEGWGTALAPAFEPIIVARKPLDGTVAQNVLRHGTGGINVDGGRIAHNEPIRKMSQQSKDTMGWSGALGRANSPTELKEGGRWPKNVVIDEEAADLVDQQRPGASRFFFQAKASRAERELGLLELEPAHREDVTGRKPDSAGQKNPRSSVRRRGDIRNIHTTVKPLALMRYLVRLVTPKGGIVLDPFVGSGTTIVAAKIEGFRGIGIELDKQYVQIARAAVKVSRSRRLKQLRDASFEEARDHAVGKHVPLFEGDDE